MILFLSSYRLKTTPRFITEGAASGITNLEMATFEDILKLSCKTCKIPPKQTYLAK